MAQTQLKLSSGRHVWPFSRGLVVESLMNAGASSAAASATGRQVELHLRQLKRKTVTPAEVHDLMVRVAGEAIGPEVAERARGQTPAFMDIIVHSKKDQLPFSRGVLARTLEDAGLAPREAHATAVAVDARLRQSGVGGLTGDEVDDLTEHVLAERFGEHMRLTYRYLRQNQGRLGVVSGGLNTPLPFSKGVLVQSLLAAGVTPDVARKVARITHRDLRGSDDRVVRRRQIREKAEALLRDEVGPDVSARYRLLRVIRRPPRPLVILLGGVSGTGKSILAAEIAYRLGIARVVSTDSIREVMRSMVSPALIPTLHASTFNAWEALIAPGQDRPAHPGRELLMSGFREQVQQVSVGLEAVVRRSVKEGASVLLEGVHLVPGYIRPEDVPHALIVPLLVTIPDDEEHRRHFESRDVETATLRSAGRYMRYFEEIRAMQGELVTLAAREDVPVLNAQTLDESAEQAVELILRGVMLALTQEERLELLGEDADELNFDVGDALQNE